MIRCLQPMQIGILGAGYTGLLLGKILREQGHEVRMIARSEERLNALKLEQFEVARADTRDVSSLKVAFQGLERLIHLAPPPRELGIDTRQDALRVIQALPDSLNLLIYGSTTGVFGKQAEGQWVDEQTQPGPRGTYGEARAVYEDTLRLAPVPVSVVRIVGIYGPRRTLAPRIEDGSLILWSGGPLTSRIHVDDLAALFASIANSSSPPSLLLACDEEPAQTLDVAKFTAQMASIEIPKLYDLNEAKQHLSPGAFEMRMSGRKCRSLYRQRWLETLRFPNYREGLMNIYSSN